MLGIKKHHHEQDDGNTVSLPLLESGPYQLTASKLDEEEEEETGTLQDDSRRCSGSVPTNSFEPTSSNSR